MTSNGIKSKINARIPIIFLSSLLLLSLFIPLTSAESTDAVGPEGIEIDSNTYIETYSFSEDRFRLVINSTINQPIVVSDPLAGVSDEGVTHVPQERINLDEGENIITFEVSTGSDLVMMGLSTPRSSVNIVEESGGVSVFGTEPNWDMVYLSGVAGAAATLLLYTSIFLVLKHKEPEEPNEVL